MVAKTTIPGEKGTNPNLSKTEMNLYKMQEDERRELAKVKQEKRIIVHLQMSVGDTETNKMSQGYFSAEKYVEESKKLKEAIYKLCGPFYYVTINTMDDDDKYYEGVFDVWVGNVCLWKKDFRRPWPPYKGLSKQIKHFVTEN